MEKPSEIAVSRLSADVEYVPATYSGYYIDAHWEVTLNWYYDSADPAEYLVVYKKEGSDSVYGAGYGSLSVFEYHKISDKCEDPEKYTYTVYTVGNGYSTSASASVTVNCQYPSYNGGGSGGSSSGSSSLSGAMASNTLSSIAMVL